MQAVPEMEYNRVFTFHIDLRNKRAEQIVIKIIWCIEIIKKRLGLFNAFFISVINAKDR